MNRTKLGTVCTIVATAIASLSPLSASAAIQLADIAHHYGFDGTTLDYAGAANGTLQGNTTLSGAGLVGSASLDNIIDNSSGVNGMRVDGVVPQLSGSFAIAAWINPRTSGEGGSGSGRFFSANDGVAIGPDSELGVGATSTDFFVGMNGGASQVRGGVPNFGTWHHFVLTADGSSMWLYIDGLLKDGPETYTNPTGLANALIGGVMLGNRDYDGLIDEFTVFNRNLTATDVGDLHGNASLVADLLPSPVPEPVSLVVWGTLTLVGLSLKWGAKRRASARSISSRI